MAKQTTKRGRGRPRIHAANLKERKWWASDAELKQVQKEADAEGCSVQELVRRRMIPRKENGHE